MVNAHVEGRGRGGHRPGPAAGVHHRDQVRGQLRAAPRRALPAAVRHRGRRRPAALVRAIEDDDYLQIYREQAAIPDISVGWDLELQALVTAPAYDGLTRPELRRAAALIAARRQRALDAR